MKNLFVITVFAFVLIACQNGQRYTQQASEIDTYKQTIADYTSQNWENLTPQYADNARIMNNTTSEYGMSFAEYLEEMKSDAANFSKWGFADEDSDYERIIDDKGRTWVNFWGLWRGTLKANGKEYVIPVHSTVQFKNGIIVEEYGYWDNSKLMADLSGLDDSFGKNENMLATMQVITEAWNTYDKDLMALALTENFIRTANGLPFTGNLKEYGKFMDVQFASFPDFKVTIDQVDSHGKKAFVYWTVTGTNTREISGHPATNKKISLPGFSVWTFSADGKAEQEDSFFDGSAINRQLGI